MTFLVLFSKPENPQVFLHFLSRKNTNTVELKFNEPMFERILGHYDPICLVLAKVLYFITLGILSRTNSETRVKRTFKLNDLIF